MYQEGSKRLIEEFLLEGLGGGDTAVVDRVFAEKHVLRSPALGATELCGLDPLKDAINEFRSDGGVDIDILEQIADGDLIATSYTLSEKDKEHTGVIINLVSEGKIQSSLVVAGEVSEPVEEGLQQLRKVFN
jgi:hypothetical protein